MSERRHLPESYPPKQVKSGYQPNGTKLGIAFGRSSLRRRRYIQQPRVARLCERTLGKEPVSLGFFTPKGLHRVQDATPSG